jgi:hypothetical protein|tara:strand:- start:2011 stop:2160 length:150 start_codon:yes stop_codon:yes gene_type:complete
MDIKENSPRIVSVEYAGVGSKPYFVVNNNNEIKFIPIEPGVTMLRDVIK